MIRFWYVARHEYTRHVFRKRFLLALFSVPLFLVFMIFLVIGMIMLETSSKPVAYIDNSGILSNPVPQPRVKWPEQYIEILAYTNEANAQDDLKAKKLQAYYVVPKDYLQTGRVYVYYLDKLKGSDEEQFAAFLKANLLVNQPPDVARRILDGNDLIIQSVDKRQEASQEKFLSIILPLVAGIVFIVAISTTSGYLIQAVTEEKENRTMEIMVTSVSPNKMMGAKVLADIAIGVTQLVVWAIFIILALVIGKSFLPSLSGIKFSVQTILIILALFTPAFIMISGLMAAVGATVTEASEGQQIMGLFTIPIWLPYIFLATFMQNPNSPLAVAMSLFPLTAPMTMTIRIGITNVPTWQVIASVGIMVLSAVGAVWLAGRAFRLGMLRYGQRVQWRELFSLARVRI